MTYTDVTQYHEGTLVLDFVDAHTKKLVFRGVGTAVVAGLKPTRKKFAKRMKEDGYGLSSRVHTLILDWA